MESKFHRLSECFGENTQTNQDLDTDYRYSLRGKRSPPQKSWWHPGTELEPQTQYHTLTLYMGSLLFLTRQTFKKFVSELLCKHVLSHFITLHSKLFTYSFVLLCCNQSFSGPFSDKWWNTGSQNMSSSSDRLDSDKLLPSKCWEQKASPVLTKLKGGKGTERAH